MTVGNKVDAGGLNATLGDCAVSLRDACQKAVNLFTYIQTLGADQTAQTAALVTLGFTQADATLLWTKSNNMFAVAQVYFGLGTQPGTFNFDNALASVRGVT